MSDAEVRKPCRGGRCCQGHPQGAKEAQSGLSTQSEERRNRLGQSARRKGGGLVKGAHELWAPREVRRGPLGGIWAHREGSGEPSGISEQDSDMIRLDFGKDWWGQPRGGETRKVVLHW